MTERLEDVMREQAAIAEIGDVVRALRAIASGRSLEAQGALAAIDSYAAQIAAAAGRLIPAIAAPSGPGVALVIGAAQGFCGGYPARIAQAAMDLAARGVGLIVIGQRSADMLADAGVPLLWYADMSASAVLVPALASEVTDVLVERGAMVGGPIIAVTGADAPGQPVGARPIWPPDPAPQGAPDALPLTTLPPARLAERLLAEALFAAVARALMHGLSAENAARTEAMARAQSNLKTRSAEVETRYRRVRQEQMTTELIELAAGRER